MSVSYTTFQDILDDVLIRGGESADESDDLDSIKRYILRGYTSIQYGDNDLLRETNVPDWWWLKKQATLTINGETNTTGRYDLPDDVDLISGVIFTARQEAIIHVGYDEIERGRQALQSLGGLNDVPTRFTIVRDDGGATDFTYQIWLNSDGPEEDLVLNYSYRKQIVLDTWSGAAEPEMPRPYRKILADYALFFLFIDQDDDRADGVGRLVQNTVNKMIQKESHRSTPGDSPLSFQLVRQGRRVGGRPIYNMERGVTVGPRLR